MLDLLPTEHAYEKRYMECLFCRLYIKFNYGQGVVEWFFKLKLLHIFGDEDKLFFWTCRLRFVVFLAELG